MTETALTHVVVDLEVGDDGWPPVTGERLWARQVGPDTYRVENAPWFVEDLAEGDIVRAVAADAGSWPVFVSRVASSGNCTIRVVPLADGPLGGDLGAVLGLFEPLGATGEGGRTYPIVALTVPPDADLPAIKALLAAGADDGRWAYEEGCISDRWRDL